MQQSSWLDFKSSWRKDLRTPLWLNPETHLDIVDLIKKWDKNFCASLESFGGPLNSNRYNIFLLDPKPVDFPVKYPKNNKDPLFKTYEELFKKNFSVKSSKLSEPFEHIPFTGGFIGYISYDFGLVFENIPILHEELDIPSMKFLESDIAIIKDNQTNQTILVASVIPSHDPKHDYEYGIEKLYKYWNIVSSKLLLTSEAYKKKYAKPSISELPKSLFSSETYEKMVEKAKSFILSGDIYQVNLSQSFTANFEGNPADLYTALRKKSPAPFMAYFQTEDLFILSSSPERFLKQYTKKDENGNTNSYIETRPIKGTIKRGNNSFDDEMLKKQLLNDIKERSEHIMIVDLERNDLGRIAINDSVFVEDLFSIETYPQVFHIVSTIIAQIKPDITFWDILKATFPGGSITGAPKIRAMEIIEELELHRRGVYTGILGYFSYSGDFDWNILIRTILINKNKLSYNAGGGIVMDSNPKKEYEETILKASGISSVIEDSISNLSEI